MGSQSTLKQNDQLQEFERCLCTESFTCVADLQVDFCALDTSGGLWRYNYDQSAKKEAVVLAKADNVPAFRRICCSKRFTIAEDNDGTLWGWLNTDWDQLGKESGKQPKALPCSGKADGPLRALSAGNDSVTLLDWSGKLWVGKDVLGDQDLAFVSLPFPVPLKAIATGSEHTLALDEEGAVWSWGMGPEGQLGRLESAGSFETPHKVSMEDTCVAIAAGISTSFVADDKCRLWAFGAVNGGVLGFSCSGFSGKTEDKLVLLPQLHPSIPFVNLLDTLPSKPVKSSRSAFGLSDEASKEQGPKRPKNEQQSDIFTASASSPSSPC